MMRLDAVLDTFSVLGSLWLGGQAPHLCFSGARALPKAAHEAALISGLTTSAATTAFLNVNVVPMDTERVLENQTVLVDGGVITALGPASQVQVPEGAVRVDGRGKYLIPGLAEMHTHGFGGALGEQTYDERVRRLFSYLASGVTTVRQLGPIGIDDDWGMFMYLKRARSFSRSTLLAPHIYVAPLMPEFGDRSSPPRSDSVGTYLAFYKFAGYNLIEIPTTLKHLSVMPPQTRAAWLTVLDSIVAVSRRLGLPVAEHHTLWPEQTLRLGPNGSTEHDDMAMGATPEGLAVLRRAGVWVTPTVSCSENRTLLSKPSQALKALQEAGVGMLLGSDASAQDRRAPSRINAELGAMVRGGLTPYQALVTGTRNVAAYLGRLDSSGTVAVGKWADLVLLDANPLHDIRHVREPVGVMIGGHWLDRAALDQGLITSPPPDRLYPWVLLELMSTFPTPIAEQRTKFEGHFKPFRLLSDSLAVAEVSSKKNGSEYRRILQRLAEELGVMRTILTAVQQRETFDPTARVWMRAHSVQGYPVVVPGVPSAR